MGDRLKIKAVGNLAKPKRGRPATGTAKTTTERVKSLDAAIIEAGGRVISRVRLSPDAAAALARISQRLGGDRSAIETALIEFDKLSLHTTLNNI